MNGTSLCLNVDVKVNLDYPEWGLNEIPALGNSRDIDAGWILLELITFNSVVGSII